MEEDSKRIQIDFNTEDVISQIRSSSENTVKYLQNYHNTIVLLREQLEKNKACSERKNEELLSEKVRLDERCTALNNQIKTLKGQLSDKETLINSYTATIDQKDLKIEKLSAVAEDYKNLTAENDDLTEQLSISRLENTHLIDENRKLIDQKSEAESELHRVKEILVYYNSLKIDKLEKAYKIFISFKERTRNNLKAVFETDTFLGFISNSMQWARIEGIWEQTKRKIVNDDNEDLQELRKLFLLLFETYNEGYTDAPYELINPIIGSRYNSNEQLIKNQKSDGTVTEVLLEGYVFKKTGAAHKAMILVE